MPYIQSQSEVTIQLGFFFSILIIMAIWELVSPRRELTISKSKRWFSNLSISIINSILIRVFFPTATAGTALYAQINHIGLFNTFLQVKPWVAVIISVIVLDFIIYLQHVMFHAVPIFWRVHRMHHVDLDIDVSTGIRFHPIEILLSLFIKMGAVVLLGIPALAVIIFQILLNATSMFNHSNVYIPLFLDKTIRWFLVTPDMHRVHHSDILNETNSNFGFNLSIWDRMMGTYTDQPCLGHEKMTIGLKTIREDKYCANLLGMLAVPFIRENR